MAPPYRIVKLEPIYRVIAGSSTRAGKGNEPGGDARALRIEHGYRIVDQGETARAKEPAKDDGPSPAPALVDAPAPPAPPEVVPAAVTDPKFAASDDALLKHMVDRSPDAVLLMSADGTIMFANATCTGLFGYAPEELHGLPIELLVPEDARRAHATHRADFQKTHQSEGARRPMARITKLQAIAKDGRLIPVDVAVSRLNGHGRDGSVFVVSVRDAAEHQAMVHGLEQLATTDPLTGLLNRRSFKAACSREFERFRRQGTALSLMVLDIDHFKTINDRFGHDVGDKALVQLATTCLAKLRRTDVMARLGGEEFTILMPGSKPEDAMILAERLRVSVSQIEIAAEAGPVTFTMSIGMARARPGDDALDQALARADVALYEAKRTGRNRIVVAAEPVPA